MRFLLLALLLLGTTPPSSAFEVVEATISEVHAAFASGDLTCRSLVRAYLDRIAAYDKNGPAINAIVLVNPDAEKEAAALDQRYAASGLTGPLHCVPVIVKDNFETERLATSNGVLKFKSYVPKKDAFQVKRIKEAGAIVLAKSNMAEWAFSPYETVSSVLPGYTKNPYALDRVSAGSSGGTAAAVAASLGLVGLGSDTGNSIRGPSSHQALAGIRSTMGLTSRGGVFPLNSLADIAGPMTRTMEDAVRVFQVIVGHDPDDPASIERPKRNYMQALLREGLNGARIGVLRQAYERESADPEVLKVFRSALSDLERAGATIVDTVQVELPERPRQASACMGFAYDLHLFLAPRLPDMTLAQVLKSGEFHPNNRQRIENALKDPGKGPDSPECQARGAYVASFREAVSSTMRRLRLDAFVYPTWSNPPRLIGDLNTPHGDNSQLFSPGTGFPAINVPMGYTRGGTLPAGITFFGGEWSEETLIRFAFAYEQQTRHRRPPPSTPPLR